MGKPDPKLLEMAEVFHMPKAARMKYIILPARMPGIARLLNGNSRTAEDRPRNEPGEQDGGGPAPE